MEEIIKLLKNCIEKKMDFKITSEEATTLLEYIDTQNKQIGIEKTVNGMKQNHVNTLTDNLEKAERKIKELTDKLNATKIKQLQDTEKDLNLQIENKKYQIRKYSNAISRIEYEIQELDNDLNII
jgi:chromosome segregation ATPase